MVHKRCSVALLALALAACGGTGSSAGTSTTSTPPSAPVTSPQAQDVQSVTTTATAVTAGLVGEPVNPSTRFVIVDAPAHGSVTLDGDSFTYTPADGYVGDDAFHYAVMNAATPSAPAKVDIEVLSTTAPPPPDLATACNGLGAGFAPLCAAIGVAATPLVQSCGALASADFCSSFGGNLYGLAEGCFDSVSGQSAVLCKAVGTALQALASQCRALNAPTDFCALLSGSAIGDREVTDYLAGPVHKALQQQWQLGLSLPLHDALVPATHNSFNYTRANTPPTVSGLDPDQLYSFTQQLDMDMRGLELDVHWFPDLTTGSYAPLLCHAETDHIGCTIERALSDGLSEIRSWLDAHPQAVIILDVEEHLDDPVDVSTDQIGKSFPAAAAAIEATLGNTSPKDILFRPGDIAAGGTCQNQDIPLDVTLKQIQAAGKQVLIYSSGCGHDPGWDSIIFDESDRLQGPATDFGDSQYPDCHYTRAQYQNTWTRFYDSSTLIDALTGSGTATPVTPSQIHEMVRCGVDMPSINFLDPHTAQLRSFVWSWAYGQPLSSPTQQCAVHNGDGRFQAESCEQLLPYACDGIDGWQITGARGVFDGGPAACAAEFPGSAFAVPRNGEQNELLKTAKTQADVQRIWLDNTDQGGNDDWVAEP